MRPRTKKSCVPFDGRNCFAEEVAKQKLAQLCMKDSGLAVRVILPYPQSSLTVKKHLPSSITLHGQSFSTSQQASSRRCDRCRPCQSQHSSLPPEAVPWGHAWSPPACFTSGEKSMGAALRAVMVQLGFVSVSRGLLVCG